MKIEKYKNFDLTDEEVFHTGIENFELGRPDLDELKAFAGRNSRNRSRFCLHRSVNDRVHEMIIAHPKGAYVRPHKHVGKAESMLILEGEADYFLFDESGSVESVVEMSALGMGKPFYKKTAPFEYHSFLIRSEWLIFLEVTTGPFNKIETVFPSWAPQDEEVQQVDQYMKNRFAILGDTAKRQVSHTEKLP